MTDGWYVQIKVYEGDGGRSISLCGKGYRQHPQLGEQMSIMMMMTTTTTTTTMIKVKRLFYSPSGQRLADIP